MQHPVTTIQAKQAKARKGHQRSKDSRIPPRIASPMFVNEPPRKQSRLDFNRLADLQLDLPKYESPAFRINQGKLFLGQGNEEDDLLNRSALRMEHEMNCCAFDFRELSKR